MLNRLDRVLAKLPQSHDGWGCPWFIVIFFFALNGMLFGLFADGSVGAGAAVVGGFMIIALMLMRDRGRCAP